MDVPTRKETNTSSQRILVFKTKGIFCSSFDIIIKKPDAVLANSLEKYDLPVLNRFNIGMEAQGTACTCSN